MVEQAIINDCNDLIKSCRTLILATAGETASHSSYAPFVFVDRKFYVLVSGLAEHTNNLINAEKKIGCMLIADESQSAQIFARKRLMFKSKPVQVESDSLQRSEVLQIFKHRFGDIVEVLNSLPDFILFELKPEQATLVKGFGDAHDLTDTIFEQVI